MYVWYMSWMPSIQKSYCKEERKCEQLDYNAILIHCIKRFLYMISSWQWNKYYVLTAFELVCNVVFMCLCLIALDTTSHSLHIVWTPWLAASISKLGSLWNYCEWMGAILTSSNILLLFKKGACFPPLVRLRGLSQKDISVKQMQSSVNKPKSWYFEVANQESLWDRSFKNAYKSFL